MTDCSRVDILNVNFFDWDGKRQFAGGAERYVMNLAAICRAKGLTPRLLQNAHGAFERHVDGIEVIGVAGASSIDFPVISRAMSAYVGDAALVIASPVELACELTTDAPIIGINHGIWWDDPAQPAISDSRGRDALFYALARAAITVCVDTNFYNWTRAVGAAHIGRIEVVPNFVDLDKFAGPAKAFDGQLEFLFPRRLCPERGFELVMQAFSRVWKKQPDLKLHLCGGGDERQEKKARRFVDQNTPRVRWSSLQMNEMPAAYRDSHVALIPTVYAEGTSLSCLEAMASGNAVIATHVGGLSDLIVGEFNGLLISPDVDALVVAIRRLAGDRTLARRLGDNARQVSHAFSIARWQSSWQKIIASVMDGRIAVPAPSRPALPSDIDAVVDTLNAEIAGARANAAGLGAEVAALKDALQRAMDDAVTAIRKVESAHSVTVGLQRSLDTTEAELAGARATLAEHVDEVAALRSQLRQAHDDAAASRQQQQAHNDVAAATSEIEAVLQRVMVDRDFAIHERDAVQQHVRALLVHTDGLQQLHERQQQTIASHEAGIRWLRDEMSLVHSKHRIRQSSLKAIASDAAYAIAGRFPHLRGLFRSIAPRRIREQISRLRDLPAIPAPAAQSPIAAFAASDGGTVRQARAGEPVSMTTRADARYDVFCFANVAWSTRYQRPHHLMRKFADDGHRVFYVVASRVPDDGAPFSAQPVGDGIWEVSLAVSKMQNFYADAMEEANLSTMRAALDALMLEFGITTAVAIVHLTYWTPLALALRSERGFRIVYDCMDEWTDFPNIGVPLLLAEQQLVEEADLVTVTAALLEDKFRARTARCLLVRNAVDFEYFSRNCVPNGIVGPLQRPIVGYYGALAEWVDFKLIAGIARARPDWSILLVGDVFVEDLAGLKELPNVHMTGRRPYEEMPKFLYHFDVCLVPFKVNEMTHAVDPVKFYEYVSVGKPVVSVPLREMRIYGDYAYFAEGVKSFVSCIDAALQENDSAMWQARIALAKDNDWTQRHDVTREAIRELHPKVSIVVISFNNLGMTRGCVESIFRNTVWPNFEVIVVDNASTDETRAWLRFIARERSNVKVVLNAENRGFAAANNQGLAVASGDFLVLLNNDTIVPRGWLEPLLAQLRQPDVGLVGPVTNFVGNEAKVDVDYRSVEDMEAFAQRWMAAHLGKEFDISMLAMFCVALRKDVHAMIGDLDERFGTGMFEDDDYSRRIQAAGLRTVCTPASFVHHFGQASFRKLIESGEYDALWKRNKAIYESKWGKWTQHPAGRITVTPESEP